MRHLVSVLLIPPLLALGAPAAHAAGSCQGMPATIESSGGTVTGTPGDDVILVTGRADVHALEGNDVICVVGGTVDAGPGDDRVEVTGPANGTFLETAYLGPGDDRYTSTGYGYDQVDAGQGGDSTGRDTISTGDGHDSVASGVVAQPNSDVIDLGPQGGSLTVLLPAGSDVRASGGVPDATEASALTIEAAADDTASWSVQLSGQVSRAGASVGTFTGFSSTRLELGPNTPVTVRGSAGVDRLSLQGGVPDVDLGGSKDFLSLDALPTGGRVDGGGGRHNWLSAASVDALEIDSRRGELGPLEMDGFQIFALGAPSIDFRGNSKPETVWAVGCRVNLRGRGGDDWLSKAHEDARPFLPSCGSYRFRMYGGAGDDRLNGWNDRDKLFGGLGRDVAAGHQGRDVCRAEVERQCER